MLRVRCLSFPQVGQAGVDLAEAVEAESTAKHTAARLETDVESALSREQAQDLAQAAKSAPRARWRLSLGRFRGVQSIFGAFQYAVFRVF